MMAKTDLNIRSVKRKNGFTLVEVSVATAILSMSVLALTIFTNSVSDLDRKFKTRSSLLQVRTEMVAALSNQQNWSDTIGKSGMVIVSGSEIGQLNVTEIGQQMSVTDRSPSNADQKQLNPELACIRDGTACVPGVYPLTLLRKDGTILIDTTNTTAGFTKDGIRCNTYGASTPGNNCVFRYEVNWTPVCPKTGACTQPQVTTQTRLVSSGSTNDVTMAALQTQMNLQMTTLIEQSVGLRPIARNQGTYTNSTVEYASDAPIVINPLTSVVSKNPVQIDSFAPMTSSMGGKVEYVNKSQIRYTPKDGYYGVDYFRYAVRDVVTQKIARGTVTVRVMTPYTWTGLAGIALNQSSNAQNFCGKVINGICDGTTFPATGWGMGYHLQLVFNNTCTGICNAVLDSIPGWSPSTINGITYPLFINSLEQASTYTGTVRLAGNMILTSMRGPWNKPVNLLIDGGIFDASAVDTVYVDAGDRAWALTTLPEYDMKKDYATQIRGNGKFLAPNNFYNAGAFYAEGAGSYIHNNGTTYMRGIYARNILMYTPGVEFYNLSFGFPAGGGMGYGNGVASDMIVRNNLIVAPANEDDNIMNGPNPSSWAMVSRPKISLLGNLIYSGTGGGFSGGGAEIQLVGTGDQNIVGLAVAPSPITTGNKAWVSTAPSVRINKSSGRTTMTGYVGIGQDFIVDQIADYDFSTSNLVFTIYGGTVNFITYKALDFNNVYEVMTKYAPDLNLGSSTINVKGNYYHGGSGYSHLYGTTLNSAKIMLEGDLIVDGWHDHDVLGKAIQIEFTGSNDQHIRSSNTTGVALVGNPLIANILINKPSGTNVYLDNVLMTMRDVIVDSGNLISSPGSGLYIWNHGWNSTRSIIKAPGTVFESLSIGYGTDLGSDLQAKTVTIGSSPGYSGLNNHGYTLSVLGDLNFGILGGDTGANNKIKMTGGVNQTIAFTNPSYTNFNPYDVSVDKAAGSVTVNGTGTLHDLCMNTPIMVIPNSMGLTVNSYIHSIGPDPMYVDTTGGGTFTPSATFIAAGGCF